LHNIYLIIDFLNNIWVNEKLNLVAHFFLDLFNFKKIKFYFSSFALVLAVFPDQGYSNSNPDIWKLYFLAGQSNMDGYGYNIELPDGYKGKILNSMIFDGNRVNDGKPEGGIGIWEELKPGHGVGFITDGEVNNLSNRFGCELSFAKQIAINGDKVAIVKYSYGGTALYAGAGYGNWDPDFEINNHYDNALATIKNAFSIRDINADGLEDSLVPKGIIWMQGESDAQYSEVSANSYYGNLKRLMSLFREALRDNNLPIVIGKINDSNMNPGNQPTQPYLSIVHEAQNRFTNNDFCALYVSDTENYNYSDPWHYDTNGFLNMGIAFAKAVLKLEETCK
tara:strand:+ start:44 stop:1054 length:1011 start_codon:yes stop_codon:yes gene_type:complete